VKPSPETIPLGGRRIRVLESEDGAVELRHGGTVLPYSVFDKNPHVGQGNVVGNKRLDAALSVIQVLQAERDERLLASKGLTLREKARIREARDAAAPPLGDGASLDRLDAVLESMRKAEAVHAEKQREANRRSQERFRLRRKAALQAASTTHPPS
jgi:hypothetical protein